MGKAVNRVFLIGRLTKDVEVRTTTTGKNVGSFTLAVDKATGEGADFFDCVAWEKTADLLAQYTGKGSKVHVEGSMQQRSWDDKESGAKRSKVEVVVRDVTFLDSKSEASGNASAPQRDNAPADIDDKPIDLSEIPF